MTRLEIERTIAAPPETVFSRCSDFENSADVVEGIDKVEMLTDGPVGPGTRFRETRTMFGREATEEMEVGAFDPPRRYTLVAESHGARYHSEFLFEEVPEGTRVRLTFDATPVTVFAKIMAVLTRPMQKKVAELLCKDLDDIKASIEGG